MFVREVDVSAGIGPWLRRELQRREWNQSDLMRRVGKSSGVVSQWINGVRVPDPDSCQDLADALGVDVDYVLTLAGHRPADVTGEQDPERVILLSMLRRAELTPERVAVLRALFDQWARHPVAARRDRQSVRPA